MNLDELWNRLESGDGGQGPEPGVTVRRIDPEATDGLFVGIRRPGGTRMLLLESAAPPRSTDGPLIQSRGFLTSVNRFSDADPLVYLCIEANSPSNNEVFRHLADDVAEHVLSRPASSEVKSTFLGRLARWKRFFEAGGDDGLSEIEVQGLLAELLFLRDVVLAESASQQFALSSWSVPEPLSKDFQFALGAVEVKSSASREHTKVYIAGERQLDDAGLPSLYVCVVLFEKVNASGTSLPEVIKSIRETFTDDDARSTFEEKLLGFGCLDAHFSRYDQRYLVHRMRAFNVKNGFPRVQSPLPDGVGDLTYSIALSACLSFEVDVQVLRKVISGSEQHDIV